MDAGFYWTGQKIKPLSADDVTRDCDNTIRVIHDNPLRICLEQAASTKGVVGIKVELSGENSPTTVEQAMAMFEKLRAQYPAPSGG